MYLNGIFSIQRNGIATIQNWYINWPIQEFRWEPVRSVTHTVMKKKASTSYHSTATAVFSRIFLTPFPLVLRSLPIHAAANEDASQLPEIIISSVHSWPGSIKSHHDRFTRLMRANPYCLGATLYLHWDSTPNFTLHSLSHLSKQVDLRFLFTFAGWRKRYERKPCISKFELEVCDALAMLSENTNTWQKVVKRWQFNVSNGKKATLKKLTFTSTLGKILQYL